jgi:hypothetical protein
MKVNLNIFISLKMKDLIFINLLLIKINKKIFKNMTCKVSIPIQLINFHIAKG